jgi:hypothetical protein
MSCKSARAKLSRPSVAKTPTSDHCPTSPSRSLCRTAQALDGLSAKPQHGIGVGFYQRNDRLARPLAPRRTRIEGVLWALPGARRPHVQITDSRPEIETSSHMATLSRRRLKPRSGGAARQRGISQQRRTPLSDPRLRCTWMCKWRERMDAQERSALDPTYATSHRSQDRARPAPAHDLDVTLGGGTGDSEKPEQKTEAAVHKLGVLRL